MKTLDPIVVGQYEFMPSVAHAGDGVLEVTVLCKGERLSRRLNHQGKHDHSPEQFAKDVDAFALLLCEELAGTIRSKELARNFANS